MKQYKEGDKSKAICSSCRTQVSTTFKMRHVPFSEIEGSVLVLASVCDQCDLVVGIPQQSVKRIKRLVG